MSNRYPHVYNPISIRGVYYKNRIMLAPPGSAALGDEHGFVTPGFVRWFSAMARGGSAVINVGNCSVDLSECYDEDGQLALSADAYIHPLRSFAEMCERYGAHGQLEINHNGVTQGNWHTATPGQDRFGPSAVITAAEEVRAKLANREPYPTIAMTQEKIDETIAKYAGAARRAIRAGMKCVMLHGAHGNLLAQFFSPYYNKRTDKYGGSIENRSRFAVEVIDAVRAAIGEDAVIEYRISAEEFEEGHVHFDETLRFIDIIKNKIDILHVSGGLHDTQGNPHIMCPMIQPYTWPQMFNVHWAADIKKAFPDLVVATVGSIKNIAQAEEIIASGKADFVAFVRALIADPDMPRKYAMGREEDHRPCIRCRCFRPLDGGGYDEPCTVNPAMNRLYKGFEYPDNKAPLAPEKKKVAVIGGGPGGVQALLTLSERGHDITLYEKSDQIGGNLIPAAYLPIKNDLEEYISYLRAQVRKAKARVLLNTEATPGLLAQEKYDALIVAIGAVPIIPNVPGINRQNVLWAPDAEKASTGDSIVVVGCGVVGLETAVEHAKRGKKVTILEMGEAPNLAEVDSALAGGYDLLRWADEYNVQMLFNSRLAEVKDSTVVYADTRTGEQTEISADTVLLAVGLSPLFNEAEAFRKSVPGTEVYLVGDCVKAGNIRDAVRGAFNICVTL